MIIATNFFEGCSSRYKNRNPVKENKDIVIGISLPSQRRDRWVRDKETMEAVAKSAGVGLKVELADNDEVQQASQIDKLIFEGVDVLIIAPLESIVAAQSVEKAHKAGIKVIDYDRFILNTDLELYVAFNNEKIGELQGEYLTKTVPKGNYILMSGSPRDFGSAQLKKGAMKFIQPLVDKGDIKIVADEAIINWEPKNAGNIVESALIKNNYDVQAILAPNDATAGGAIVALSKHGLVGKVAVSGQDADLLAAKRIIQGIQSMTVFKDVREEAKVAMVAAIKMAKGEKINTTATVNNGKMDVPLILLEDLIVVDKNNLDKVLIESGYLKKEDVYNK